MPGPYSAAYFVGGGVPDVPHGGTRFPGIVGRPAHRPPRRGQDPSLQCKPKKGDAVRPRAGHARPLQRGALCRGRHALPVGRRAACPLAAAEGSRPLPTMQTGKGGMPLGCGPGMPGPYSAVQCVGAAHLVGGGVPDAPQGGTHCPGGRRAACPQAAAEGARPLPTMQTGKGGCR